MSGLIESSIVNVVGGGGGTVSSVGISTTAQDLTISGSPITTTGTIAIAPVAEYNAGSQTTAVTINWNNGTKQRVTLTSGRTVTFPSTVQYPHGIGTPWTVSGFSNTPCAVTFSNPVDGTRYVLRFIQGDTLIVDEVVLDYANSTYTVFSFQTYDPNARNTAFSSSFPNNQADYVSVTDSGAFTFGTGGCTLSAWIYTNGASGVQSIVEHYNPAGNSPGFAWRLGANVSTKIGFYSANSVGGSFFVDDSVAIVSNTWTHVAVTYTATSVVFYQNGVATVTRTVTNTSIDAATAALVIGVSSNGTPNHPWNGYLRDISLWTGGLTSGNIAALYNSNRPPDILNASSISGFLSSLVAWWKLGDGDTTAAWADSSGNAHNGTTTGALSIVNAYPNP